MGRDENVAVFKDTEKICKTTPKLSESVKKSIAAQKLILEGDSLEEQNKGRYEDVANVIVTKLKLWHLQIEMFLKTICTPLRISSLQCTVHLKMNGISRSLNVF